MAIKKMSASQTQTLAAEGTKNVRLKDVEGNALYPESDSNLIIHEETTVYAALVAVIAAAATAQSTAESKQDKLTAGTGISISNNTISCTLDTTVAKVVTSLPSKPDSGDENKIFFVPATVTEAENIYVEYLWVNSAWEKLGEYKTDVDLSSYLTKSEASSTYATKSEIPTLSDLGGVGSVSASGTSPLSLSTSKSGTTVTITGSVSNATASAAGLMSASDKSTLDSLSSGAVTSVSASGTSPLTLSASISSGKLTITGSVDLSAYAKASDLSTVQSTADSAASQAATNADAIAALQKTADTGVYYEEI